MRAALIAVGSACVALAALGRFAPSLFGALTSPWMAQCWGALGIVVLLLVVARAWRAAAILAVPLAALSLWVVPVLVPHEPAAASRSLRIAYANVNAWNAPSADAVRWFEQADADVVALIECSVEWADALRDAAAREGRPWLHECARIDDEAIAGAVLLSRHPLREARALVSPHGRFPMIDATVDAPDGPVRMLVAHPVPPVGFGAVAMRDAELAWIAQRCAAAEGPIAIVADFNDTPFGRALRDFGAISGMRSAAAVSGLVTTWPARVAGVSWPAPLRIAIDHCFVSRGVDIAAISAGPDIGSDHLPLVIDIAYGPRAGGEPARPGSQAP
jgi:endonuclease/exonuclease/phosphatase (EEP) superfamily protein YafD